MRSSRTSYTVFPAAVAAFCQTLFKIAIFSTLICTTPVDRSFSKFRTKCLSYKYVYTTRASIHFLLLRKFIQQKRFCRSIFYKISIEAFIIILSTLLIHYCNLKLKYIKVLSEMFRIKWKLKINNKAERTCCKVAKTLTCKMLNCILNFLLWLEDWVALVWWYDVIYNHTALYVYALLMLCHHNYI